MTCSKPSRWWRKGDDDGERGSMHVLALPIAVAFVTAAVLVITMVGSATNDRRQAGTAADAAALAAAQEWDDQLGLLHVLHLGAGESSLFWALLGESVITAGARDDMQEAAEYYAERNGAEVVGDIDVDAERLRVTVTVRHEDTVPGTDVRSTASATARIRLNGGLCLSSEGLGWRIDGECVTQAPDDESDGGSDDESDGGSDDEQGGGSDDSGDEDEQDDEEDDWTAPEVGRYGSSVILSD